jgi:hypothetical protein
LKRAVLGAVAGIAIGLALAARPALRAPVFDPRAAMDTPWLVAEVPPVLPVLAAAALFGALGALAGRRGREDLLTPFVPCGLAAAVFVPGVFARAPFVALFSGRFLDLLLFLALAISLSRLVRPRPLAISTWTVLLVGFVSYLAVGSWISKKVGLSGDEPHYLLITYSLLHDFDLAVQNNYGAQDYRSFYDGKVEPRLAVGTPYSVHGIGVPLLLLPGFAAAGLRGVLVTEAVLAALLLAAIYEAALRLTASPSAALYALAGFGLTSPALFLSVSAYPELPAALASALSLRRLLDPNPPRGLAALVWTLALGTLPFFHVKFVPLAGLLIAAFAYRFARERRSLFLPFVAGAALSTTAFLLFSFFTTGSYDPTAAYGRQRVFLDRVPLGVAGLLFDQEFGLLLHAPVYLLGLAGIVTLFRRNRLQGTFTLLALLVVAIPGAAHPLWSGGTSAPARFLFPALPLMMVAAAALLESEREIGVGRWAPWLLASSLGVSLSMLFLPGGPFFLNGRDGRGQIWEALSSSWDLTDYLPSLVRADPRSLACAAGLSLLVLLALGAQIRRTRGFPLAPFLALLLVAAWGYEGIGVSRSRVLEARWVLDIMHHLSRSAGGRFFALPPFEPLSREELGARVSLPLEALSGDGDPRHWWSRAYSIPAGRFRLSGAPPMGVTFFNGEGAFQSDQLVFSSRVALGQFRLRVRNLFEPPRLFLLEPRPSAKVALATISADGLRLHSLGGDVYLDPTGFWIRKGSRASFAMEVEPAPSGTPEARIELANGGAPNVVSIASAPANASFSLAPWEEREIRLAMDGPVLDVIIESESGFRPSDLDPRTRDDRELGVLVRARPAF